MEVECLPLKFCEAVEALWKDGGVKQAFEISYEYYLLDSAASLLNEVKRFADAEYIPTDIDILMARVKTRGIHERRLRLDEIEAWVFDVGGVRREREKWIHTFESVSVLVFLVDIAAWDQVLFEDETVNRTQEDLVVFESIVNSRWFLRTGFVLLFTKMDKLERKLKQKSRDAFKQFFPDFEGDGKCVDDVTAYLKKCFLEKNKRETRHIEVIFNGGYSVPASTIRRLLSVTWKVDKPITLAS